MVVRRIGPISAARIAGSLYALIGLLLGAIFSLLAITGAFVNSGSTSRGVTALLGVGAVIVFPILYGAIGFVASLIAAWLYNLLSRFVGGVQIEIE